MVQHYVCVELVAGREDDDLEALVHFPQTLYGSWSDVNASLNDFSVWKGDWQDDVRGISSHVIHTVDQRLIEVKDYCFLAAGLRHGWQVHCLREQLVWLRLSQVLQVLQRLKRL